MRRLAAAALFTPLVLIVLLPGCAGYRERALADEALSIYPETPGRFASEAELVAWLSQAKHYDERAATLYFEQSESRRKAQCRRGSLPPWSCPEFHDPKAEDDEDDEDVTWLDKVEVTGSRLSAAQLGFDSITNNQEATVDEGDIVKKAGDFLFVLGNGVLNVVRIGAGGKPTLALTDRLVVDEDGEDDTWYDEILAQGDRVILLGFRHSGSDDVSELRAFRVDADGRLRRDGVYWLRTSDYFSATNYGVRLHAGHLLMSLSIPLDLDDASGLDWPEWSRRDVPAPVWNPLLQADDLHYPVYMPNYGMAMHVVLRCPLSGLDEATLDCRATGVVGGWRSTIYVSGSNTWLAVEGLAPDAVRRGDVGPYGRSDSRAEPPPWSWRRTAVYRVPHDGGAPRFATVAGEVSDQFDFAEVDGGVWLATRDRRGWDDDVTPVRLYRVDDTALDSRREAEMSPHAELVMDAQLDHVRFARQGLWLAGTREDPKTGDYESVSQVRVVPLSGGPATSVPVDVQVQSLQPMFDRMLVVGQAEPPALGLSLYSDDGAPRRLSSRQVPYRVGAESRSHALNFAQLPNGATLLGLPTLAIPNGVEFDDWDQEEAADLEFFSLQGDALQPIGRIDMSDQVDVKCENSCYDWYGDARLFFVGNRIFALSGTVIKEAEVLPGGLRTLRRVALAPATAGD